MHRLACILFVVLLATPAIGQSGGQPAAAEPTLQFLDRAVSASGATPGGQVVFFNIARELRSTRPPIPRIVRRLVEATADASGVARMELDQPVPLAAIWVAVDQTTGGSVAAPSPGFEATPVALSPSLARPDGAGQLKKVEWPFAEMELLLVRPGAGVWHLYAAKYSALDENRLSEGALRLDLDRMQAFQGSSQSPATVKAGDVIVMIDPRWMQYGVLQVGK
jgi:hypothetical protein